MSIEYTTAAKLQIEIDRLSDEAANDAATIKHHADEIRRLRAENAQLFEAVGGATRESAKLRTALEIADKAIVEFVSHQVGYQTAYVHFLAARDTIHAALANEQKP